MKSFDKLKDKLAELFQLDQADLDFGIYRIMNARRDEILRFLDRDLLPQVQEAFKQYKSSDKVELKKELEQLIEGIKKAGMAPEQSPKVIELRRALEADSVDIAAEEAQVYDHLYNFFSRYYDEGDFISLRRYKEGVYAIPYEGEEVKLHWANHDQYYVKTTQYCRDYAFKVADGDRVHFKIVEADTEKDNIKSSTGNDRRFLLHGESPIAEEGGELIVRFEYRPDPDKRKQDAINSDTVEKVIANLNTEALAQWQRKLCAKAKKADGTELDRTVLEKHLNDYTKRNTFDYFIHKNLGRFLRRELDFYIKNEVMRLDDIEEESAARVEQYLSKIKVIRRIAHKIIDFLAQIEDFQKKLWLKKKFVFETNYCVTLDRVPEELYPEIAANEVQRKEWVRLFAIDEIKGDLGGRVDYSEPLTVEFLKANKFLLLDTKFLDKSLFRRLVAEWSDIDAVTDGLGIHGENFQALGLLRPRYEGAVQCIYIDPPYNTSASEIIYKNSYKSSSWLSFISGPFDLSYSLLRDGGIACITIDDFEFHHLISYLESHYSDERILGVVSVKNNPSGRATGKGFSIAHEYAIFFARDETSEVGHLSHSAEQIARYKESDEIGSFEWVNFRKHGGANANRYARPKLFYPFFATEDRWRIPAMHWDGKSQSWMLMEKPSRGEQILFPVDTQGVEKTWKWGHETGMRQREDLKVGIDQSGGRAIYMKSRLNEAGTLPRTIWDKKEYSATEYGTNLLSRILGEKERFSFPKSVHAVEDCLRVSGIGYGGLVADYFAGSGTTGHAVVNMNRSDGGSRKYILVELGEHFHTALKPRIQRVVYSQDWRDGKPISREGISHMFKYIRLESYEDALANIDLKRSDQQELALGKSADFRESYMLKYMLETEVNGSQTLLNIERFDDPFRYKLMIGTGSVGETKPVNVDLVETFNWLLGLKVRHMSWPKGYKLVEGEDPDRNKVLVIWRKIRDLAETDPDKIIAAREQSNRELDEFFRKQQYNTLDSEFDLIYVNGDNNLMNIPLDPAREGVEPRYKVRLIEVEFKRLMFDVQDI